MLKYFGYRLKFVLGKKQIVELSFNRILLNPELQKIKLSSFVETQPHNMPCY